MPWQDTQWENQQLHIASAVASVAAFGDAAAFAGIAGESVAPTDDAGEETAGAAGHGASAMALVADSLAFAERTEASPPPVLPKRTKATAEVAVAVDPTSAAAAERDTRKTPEVHPPPWLGWIAGA